MKIILGLGLIMLIIASIFVWSNVIKFIANSGCQNDYMDKVYSPDDKYYVQVLRSSCGGAIGDIAMFTMLHKSDGNSEDDSIHIFDMSHGANINTIWIDNRTLKISYDYCEEIFTQKNSWNDVKIIYEEQCSSEN